MTRVAVLDIGKTNVKLALVDAEAGQELAVPSRPNRVLPGPPYPHYDVDAHWQFFLAGLAELQARHGVDAISVTTHGASVVLLDRAGGLAAPVLDYEHDGPDEVAEAYDALRPGFAETGSARMRHGLNVGAQLHWQMLQDPGLRGRMGLVVSYPGYWVHRLTGRAGFDLTSIGCHTDLWNPTLGQLSALPERLGIAGLIAPRVRPSDIAGTILPEVAQATGLPPETPVVFGIHDSNASLLPHLLGRKPPFAVVSTGTWVVSMAVGGEPVTLNPARDTLVNVNALGQPTPSARFMGGREHAVLCGVTPAAGQEAAADAVLARGLMVKPAVQPDSGPFPGRKWHWWPQAPGDAEEAAVAGGYYLALMTAECLGMIGAAGLVLVEGPFSRNPWFIEMLAAATGRRVQVSTSRTGTSAGAALLCMQAVPQAEPDAGPGPTAAAGAIPEGPRHARLQAYAAAWHLRVRGGACG
jgi:sugar (pentulose or hexulose) kinase